MSDSASNSPQTASLTGTGTEPSVAVHLTPTAIDFDPQPVSTTGPAKAFTVISNETGAVTNIAIWTTGSHSKSPRLAQ